MAPLTRAAKRKLEAEAQAVPPPQPLPVTASSSKRKAPPKKQHRRAPPPRITTVNAPWPMENLASAGSTAMSLSAVTPTYPILTSAQSQARSKLTPKRVRIAPLNTASEPTAAPSAHRRQSTYSAPAQPLKIAVRNPPARSSQRSKSAAARPPRRSWAIVGHLVTRRADWPVLWKAWRERVGLSPRSSSAAQNTSQAAAQNASKSNSRSTSLGASSTSSGSSSEDPKPRSPKRLYLLGLDGDGNELLTPDKPDAARWPWLPEGVRIVLTRPEERWEGLVRLEADDNQDEDDSEWERDTPEGSYPYPPYLAPVTHPTKALHAKHGIRLSRPDEKYFSLFVAGYDVDGEPRLEAVERYYPGLTEVKYGEEIDNGGEEAPGGSSETSWQEPRVTIRVYGEGAESLAGSNAPLRGQLYKAHRGELSEGEILVGYDAQRRAVWKPIFGLEGYEGLVQYVTPGIEYESLESPPG